MRIKRKSRAGRRWTYYLANKGNLEFSLISEFYLGCSSFFSGVPFHWKLFQPGSKVWLLFQLLFVVYLCLFDVTNKAVGMFLLFPERRQSTSWGRSTGGTPSRVQATVRLQIISKGSWNRFLFSSHYLHKFQVLPSLASFLSLWMALVFIVVQWSHLFLRRYLSMYFIWFLLIQSLLCNHWLDGICCGFIYKSSLLSWFLSAFERHLIDKLINE